MFVDFMLGMADLPDVNELAESFLTPCGSSANSHGQAVCKITLTTIPTRTVHLARAPPGSSDERGGDSARRVATSHCPGKSKQAIFLETP